MLSTFLQLMKTSAVVRKLNRLGMFDDVRIVRTPNGLESTIQLRYCGITALKDLRTADFIANTTIQIGKKNMKDAKIALKELERDRKRAQRELYERFLHSGMTVAQYEKSSIIIDSRYGREQALVLVKAIHADPRY